MCGIAGFINLDRQRTRDPQRIISLMKDILKHRGPDEEGVWIEERGRLGLASRRLSIVDLNSGQQPMISDSGCVIVYNGEIYNHLELRAELGQGNFKTTSDTEVILQAYEKWGTACFNKLRGMFSFAIWDPRSEQLVCARDRFGIKPFYYVQIGHQFFFASEAKALLPFLPSVDTNLESLKEYLVFQYCLKNKTLFKDIFQLPPAHYFICKDKSLTCTKYWELNHDLNLDHSVSSVQDKLLHSLHDSVRVHLRSDVPVSVFLSGGFDSSLVAVLSSQHRNGEPLRAVTGKFSISREFDESEYAQAVAEKNDLTLDEIDITCSDFIDVIQKVVFALDYPAAGPGSFAHYMTSRLASTQTKVVLGGLGGDEIFGGYVRYFIANSAMSPDQTRPDIPLLRNYGPLIDRMGREGTPEEGDRLYFNLISRAGGLQDIIDWNLLQPYSVFSHFKEAFGSGNGRGESYFEKMVRFDFETLLPALLHVEDRMSMAHGLESRVPFLDHQVVELLATVPPHIKFNNGELKHLLKSACKHLLPKKIVDRTDKMGFPVPLSDWMKGELYEFVFDILNSRKAKMRPYLIPGFDPGALIEKEGKFDRNLWGLLCLEIWQREFHDRIVSYV